MTEWKEKKWGYEVLDSFLNTKWSSLVKLFFLNTVITLFKMLNKKLLDMKI